MDLRGNGSDRGSDPAKAGIIIGSGPAKHRISKLSALYDFVKITAGAVGLALLLANPAGAASIETPPGAAPPGAAVAKQRADVNADRIEDALAARMAGSANGERFDVIVIFEGPNAVSRGRAAAGPFAVTREFSLINGFQASLTAGQIRGLSRANGLFSISANAEVKAFDTQSNADMGVTAARNELGYNGSGVTICVIDTGIDASHEQFDTKGLGPGSFHDAVNGLADPYDDHGHGSHVSGIATGDGAGVTSLADDAIGVAPGASLVVAKVLAADGTGSDAQVIEGIEWCATRGDVDILSMSLGGDPTDGSDPLSLAVNCVADPSPVTCGGSNGAKIVVIAAGNSGALWSTVGAPGTAANAITVGSVAEWSGNPATNWQDDGLYLNAFSSRGPVVDGTGAVVRIKPDITGPGSRVLSAYIDSANNTPNAYGVASGTSMSTPFVAGVIALMLEADPTLGVVNADGVLAGVLPHVKVRNILALTAEHRGDLVPNNEYGYGVIDAYSAVSEASGVVGYVPNAYPGYTRLPGESVADFGNWTFEFNVTPDLVGLPIAGTATIDGTFVETCLLWLGADCWLWDNLWSPDLEVILEQELPAGSGSWSQVAAGSGEATFSECPARGECGTIGRAEVVHFIPPGEGNFRFRVFPADDTSNLGVGGSFDFEVSMGAPDSGPVGNSRPVVAIALPANGAIFTQGDPISFAGSANDFEDGDLTASLVWSSSLDGAIGSGAGFSTAALSLGTHVITASVTDSEGQPDDASITVTVNATNTAPTASFGFSAPDLTVSFTDTSTDPDGTIASWSWDFGDGNFSAAQSPSHTYAAAGTYTVILTVTDNDGDSDSDSQSVTVTVPAPNVPPTASFTVDRNPCGSDLFLNTCEFTDTSTDTDGSVLSWDWDFGGGSVIGGLPMAPGHKMLVQFPANGPNPVTVSLTVTDDDGATHFATMQLPIRNPAPPPPLAGSVHIADLDDISVLAPRGRWDAVVSVLAHDSNGATVSGATVDGAWSNGTSGTGSCVTDTGGQCTITKANLKGNVSLVTFSVTSIASAGLDYAPGDNIDPDGDSNGTAIDLAQPGTVTSQPPVASFTVDRTPCGTELFANTCLFTDTSTDPDGDVVSWSWDFGDGQAILQQGPHLVQFPADGPNPVTVTLTVTDTAGAIDSTSMTLEISDPVTPPPPPPDSLTLLTAQGYKVKGIQTVDLTWSGGPVGGVVYIRRDGVSPGSTANDFAETISIGLNGGGSYVFEVCDSEIGGTCSNAITVIF